MSKIDLRRVDLNLLLLFEVLMLEGSVSNTADQLGRTQSAVSHALARLREQLGDPLLVKVGGRMQPSPYALELMQEIRPILRSIERVLSPREAFDPAASTRRFRLAVPDMGTHLFPHLMQRVHQEAPGSRSNGKYQRPTRCWTWRKDWLTWPCYPMPTSAPMEWRVAPRGSFNGLASCAKDILH